MKKFVASLLLVSSLSSVVRAEEVPKVQPAATASSTVSVKVNPVDAVITPLKKGQPAPFPGVLFSQPAAASVVADISVSKEKIKAEVDKAVTTAVAEKQLELDDVKSRCAKDKTDLGSQLEGKTKDIVRLSDDLKIADARIKKLEADMPSRSTWFTVGLVGGIVVTVVTVFAVGQIAK